jgi:hypothetical protein
MNCWTQRESSTTYQLLDEVRQDTARTLLTATDLESGEIAFLLGFEELNSFTRAFHDWEGATPMRWRAVNLGASKVANGSRQCPVVHRTRPTGEGPAASTDHSITEVDGRNGM